MRPGVDGASNREDRALSQHVCLRHRWGQVGIEKALRRRSRCPPLGVRTVHTSDGSAVDFHEQDPGVGEGHAQGAQRAHCKPDQSGSPTQQNAKPGHEVG